LIAHERALSGHDADDAAMDAIDAAEDEGDDESALKPGRRGECDDRRSHGVGARPFPSRSFGR